MSRCPLKAYGQAFNALATPWQSPTETVWSQCQVLGATRGMNYHFGVSSEHWPRTVHLGTWGKIYISMSTMQFTTVAFWLLVAMGAVAIPNESENSLDARAESGALVKYVGVNYHKYSMPWVLPCDSQLINIKSHSRNARDRRMSADT
jgi:hypothetical protein